MIDTLSHRREAMTYRSQETQELIVTDLCKVYPNGVAALQHVSLSISCGMFGLLGANGAGKTTLMNILATLVEPSSGSLRLGPIDPLRDPTAMRQQVGYLPQEFGVYPGMSAVAMLDYFAILKGIADPAARRVHIHSLLELVNLDDVKARSVDTYSGGMRRRFGVAQALLGNPRVVIVDEPTAGLDPVERNRFQHALSNIGDERIVILSTHIIEDVASICANSAILDGGHVVAQGDPRNLTERLAGLVWERSFSRDEPVPRELEAGMLASRPGRDGTVVAVLSEQQPGAGFVLRSPDLQDVFFAAKAGHLGP